MIHSGRPDFAGWLTRYDVAAKIGAHKFSSPFLAPMRGFSNFMHGVNSSDVGL